MSAPQPDETAEWTPVTPREPSDDRSDIGKELDGLRINLGLSVRAMADKIEVDRETLRRVFAGDPTVRENKLRMIERKVRALDEEMSSERQEVEADDTGIVSIKIPAIAGGVVVSGHVENLDGLMESVRRLVHEYLPQPDMEDQSPPAS